MTRVMVHASMTRGGDEHNPLTVAGVNDIADQRCPNRF
jgi:hypothetical protein